MILVNDQWWSTAPDYRLEEELPDGWRTRERTSPPTTIVLHWTGGEGNARQVARTLARRNLSVHFFVDQWGLITQFADPARTITLHAGSANRQSVGVEIANYAYTSGKVPEMGKYRELTSDEVHGRRFQHADFWPAQKLAVLSLCDALTTAIPSIPRRVFSGQSIASWQDITKGGVAGHFHFSLRKVDPGTGILGSVRDHWRQHV